MAGFTMNLDPQAPFMFERMLRLWRLGTEDEMAFATEEEFRTHMEGLDPKDLSRRYARMIKDKPSELAQELAYQAYEAGEPTRAIELTGKALELDPDCAEALTVQARMTIEDVGELIGRLEHAVTCGEKSLGEEFFAAFRGDFWPMVEARPYMRSLRQLAEILWNVGRRFDAVAQYENLMALDPWNYMGNGAMLLGDYLAMGEIQRSWDLLEKIDDEIGAVYNWSWVLLFLMIEDEEGARQALDHALDMNSYVAPLLIGLSTEEKVVTSPTYRTGSRDEAHLCIQMLGQAWATHFSAHWWLLDELRDMGLLTEDDGPLPEDPQTIN